MKKRKYVRYADALDVAKGKDYAEYLRTQGVRTPEWDNMGWCKDGVTRWYHFESADGKPCYTLKY